MPSTTVFFFSFSVFRLSLGLVFRLCQYFLQLSSLPRPPLCIFGSLSGIYSPLHRYFLLFLFFFLHSNEQFVFPFVSTLGTAFLSFSFSISCLVIFCFLLLASLSSFSQTDLSSPVSVHFVPLSSVSLSSSSFLPSRGYVVLFVRTFPYFLYLFFYLPSLTEISLSLCQYFVLLPSFISLPPD